LRDGVISEDVFDNLTTEIDAQLMEGTVPMPGPHQTGTEFLEVTVPPNARVARKSISELRLPRSAVLVSILRGDEVIIPRGDTRLRPGDIVTILSESNSAEAIREFLQSTVLSRRKRD
jgi:Trk K+ transport system NAD-binding subunit